MKHKRIAVSYIFSSVAILLMRICQLLFAIESETGFYKPEYSYFGYISVSVLLVFSAVMIYLSFSEKERIDSKTNSKLSATFSALTAGGILAKAVTLLITKPSNFAFAVSAAAVIAAVGYFVYSQDVFTSGKINVGMLLLTIPFWILELVYIFVENNDISAVPERSYDIITVVLCLIFALSFIKLKAEMVDPFRSKLTFAVGLIASAFCFISTVPRYMVILLGNKILLHNSAISDALFPIYGIFILTVLFSKGKALESDVEEDD